MTAQNCNTNSELYKLLSDVCYKVIKDHDITAFDEYSGKMSDEDARLIGNAVASKFINITAAQCANL